MELIDILKYKDLQNEIEDLVRAYYQQYMSRPYAEYCRWDWSVESDKIRIIYKYLDYRDQWECDDCCITIEELVNFSKNRIEN